VSATSYAPPYSQTIEQNSGFLAEEILLGDGNEFRAREKISSFRLTSIVPIATKANFDNDENTFDVDFMDRFRVGTRQQFHGEGNAFTMT